MTASREPRKITGRMVLFGLTAFFGVISAVNGVFMYFALDTWPGLTTEDAYKKGVAYNRTLADGERQAALGWKTSVDIDGASMISVSVTGVDDQAVTGLSVKLTMQRPVGAPQTTTVPLTETARGRYAGVFAAPLAGRWKADVTAEADDGTRYRMVHEVMIKR